MSALIPVILSGGSGTRLWPLSRESHPKQFLPLLGEHSLLQMTWLRLRGLPGAGAPMVVANEEHRFLVAEQLRQVGASPSALILEPVGRNTAPAIAVAALKAVAEGEDPVLLVLPSDHVIADEQGFRQAVLEALPAAEAGGLDGRGALVTFGIVPTSAETGYGYINAAAGTGVRAVLCFVEKPDQFTAEKYVASGEYFWNSGMFAFRASRYLEELGKSQPKMVELARRGTARMKLDAIRRYRDRRHVLIAIEWIVRNF